MYGNLPDSIRGIPTPTTPVTIRVDTPCPIARPPPYLPSSKPSKLLQNPRDDAAKQSTKLTQHFQNLEKNKLHHQSLQIEPDSPEPNSPISPLRPITPAPKSPEEVNIDRGATKVVMRSLESLLSRVRRPRSQRLQRRSCQEIKESDLSTSTSGLSTINDQASTSTEIFLSITSDLNKSSSSGLNQSRALNQSHASAIHQLLAAEDSFDMNKSDEWSSDSDVAEVQGGGKWTSESERECSPSVDIDHSDQPWSWTDKSQLQFLSPASSQESEAALEDIFIDDEIDEADGPLDFSEFCEELGGGDPAENWGFINKLRTSSYGEYKRGSTVEMDTSRGSSNVKGGGKTHTMLTPYQPTNVLIAEPTRSPRSLRKISQTPEPTRSPRFPRKITEIADPSRSPRSPRKISESSDISDVISVTTLERRNLLEQPAPADAAPRTSTRRSLKSPEKKQREPSRADNASRANKTLERQVSRFFSTSRFASIPFAFLYGFIIYFCIAYLLWPPAGSVVFYKPINSTTPNSTTNSTAKTITPAPETETETSGDTSWHPTAGRPTPAPDPLVFGDAQAAGPTPGPAPQPTSNDTIIGNCSNKWLDERRATFQKVGKKVAATWVSPSLKAHGYGIAIGAGVSGLLAFGTVKSQYARCVTMLVLPNLMSGRGRAALMTLALGFLIDGPIASIQYNIEQIIESMTCLYRLMNQVSCQYNGMVEKAEGNNQPEGTRPPILDTNGSRLLKIGKIPEIQKEFVHVLDSVRDFTLLLEVIFFWLKRILIVLSMILLVRDAVAYYRLYYIDVSHDNMYVDRSIRKLWKRGAVSKVTPLRRWEKKKDPGYKEHQKFTCFDFKEIIKRALPTIFFVMQAALFVALDWGLSSLLQEICEKGAYEVMFNGLEHLTMKTKHLDFEWSISKFKVRRMKEDTDFTISLRNVDFPLSDLNEFIIETRPCLPWPTHTKWNVRIYLLVITMCACLTHVLEIFIVRLRSRICNYFNAKQADRRAADLYDRIILGREIRAKELSHVVSNEIRMRKRRRKLSVFYWFMKKLGLDKKLSLKKKEAKRCPGCLLRIKKKKTSDPCMEELEEQRDSATLPRRGKSSRLESMESSDRYRSIPKSENTSDRPFIQGMERRYAEDDSISVGELSIASDTVLKHLDVSDNTKFGTLKRNGTLKQNITRHSSRDSSIAGDKNLGWHYLFTVLCDDCVKDVEIPKPEENADENSNSQLLKPDGRQEKDVTMMSDQESLSEYVTGMWK